jgi:phosphoglycolate phosphatase
MTKYDVCVWDWNGTLLDDTWLCVESLNLLLTEEGLPPVTIDAYREHFRFPAVDYYSLLGFPGADSNFPEISRRFMQAYGERVESCQLRAGVTDLLDHFKQINLSQTIVSASPIGALEYGLRHFQIEEFFTEVAGQSDNFAHGKIETGLNLMRKLGGNPTKVIFIGDTVHDFEVANAMGVDCVLLTGGHQSADRLRECGVPVFECVEEIKTCLT